EPCRSKLNKEQAIQLANESIAKLEADANDVPAREKLAGLYAENLNQLTLALEQMELLLAMPGLAPRQAAEWLTRMATWQLNLRSDTEAAQQILKRLISEYPQTPQAFHAQQRLYWL